MSKEINKVRQSNHLIESPYSQEFTVHEIKLFEIALADCKLEDLNLFKNKNNKEFKYSNSVLAKLLNTSVSTISHEIEKTAARIMKKTIHLRKVLPDDSVEFEMINIMPYAKYKNGILDFQINYQIIPYLIELNSNFTEFNLDNLLIMNSSYGIKLYKLLYQYKNIKSRKFSIIDLKEQFGIRDKYPQYGDFKKYVVNPAIKQINEMTDLEVNFIEKKMGRKVESLEFDFHLKNTKLTKLDILSESVSIKEVELSEDNTIIIKQLIGNKFDEISDKTKVTLNDLISKKSIDFVECSINYAKKYAKTNFEKYLLDTIENNWAEVDIQKLEAKRQAEEKDCKNKQSKIEEKNKQIELDNVNKSEIEHLFIKLTDFEQAKYTELANIILQKYANKLSYCDVETLSYSVFAVSNGRFYNKAVEVYISKMLNHSLNINDYKII